MKKLIFILIANTFAIISFAQSISYDYDQAGRVSLIQYPNGQNIRYSYDAAGNRLTKENDVPCGLIPAPVISAAGATSFCPGDSVVLRSAVGSDITYQWRKNGKNILGATASNYTALTTGIYKVVVTQINNCIDSSAGIAVTLFPKPSVGFTLNTASQCLAGNNFIFNDTSTISLGTLQRSWTFGDGDTSTLLNPRKTYTASNIYSVKIIVTSGQGCKDSLSKVVTVKPQTPASITTNNSTSFCNGGNATLLADTGTGLTYQWKLNGSNIGGATASTYTTSATGNYTVVTTNNFGCKDTSNTITIGVNAKPLPGFTTNTTTQCLGGNNFIFTDTSRIVSGTLTRAWTFGDGDTSTLIIRSKTYTTAGTFIVKLVSTSSAGCKDSISKTVTVNTSPPASIAGPNSVSFCPGQSVTLSGDTGTGFTYQWRNNGVNIAGAINRIYIATTAGSFKVVVTNNKGCSDSSTAVTAVLNPKPGVGFTINNSSQCLSGNNFIFNDTTSSELSRKWDLGTGDSSVIKSPVKTFLATGTFTIKLIATGTNGCKDTAIKTVSITPKPTASFSINNTIQCLTGNSFSFTDVSTVSSGTLTRKWDFGNGDTSTQLTPTINYASAAVYTVKLVASTNGACKDSISKTITVNAMPNAGFTTNNPSQCMNSNSFIFTDTSSVSGGTVTRTWAFGDSTADINNPSLKSFNQSGTFSVNLVSTSNKGCQTSVSKTIDVNPQPHSAFTVNNGTQCLNGNNFVFTDLSTISSGSTTSQWSFGNGDVSTAISPSEHYVAAGNYVVKLVSISNSGCKDSTGNLVTVDFSTGASINTTRGTGSFCNNDSITLNATPGSTNTYQWLENGVLLPLATQSRILVKQTAFYQVIVSNTSNSCIDTSAQFATTAVSAPVVGPITGPLQIGSLLTTSVYSVTPQAGNLYYWTLVGANIISGQGTPTLTVQWVLRGAGRIRLKMVNSTNCFDTSLININVTTGIASVFEDNIIELYPNPASDQFMLTSSSLEMNSLNLYDSRGRLVISKDVYAKESKVDIAELGAGMYMVEVKTNAGVKFMKVVKN